MLYQGLQEAKSEALQLMCFRLLRSRASAAASNNDGTDDNTDNDNESGETRERAAPNPFPQSLVRAMKACLATVQTVPAGGDDAIDEWNEAPSRRSLLLLWTLVLHHYDTMVRGRGGCVRGC